MNWRYAKRDDLDLLTKLNRRLQEDEGADPMTLDDIRRRLVTWLGEGYQAVLFEQGREVVAYSLFRPTDRDREGADGGIYIQQFYVLPERRRCGVGRQAFEQLVANVWPEGCGILLDTVYENRRAQCFWRSLGFSEHRLSFKSLPAVEARTAKAAKS